MSRWWWTNKPSVRAALLPRARERWGDVGAFSVAGRVYATDGNAMLLVRAPAIPAGTHRSETSEPLAKILNDGPEPLRFRLATKSRTKKHADGTPEVGLGTAHYDARYIRACERQYPDGRWYVATDSDRAPAQLRVGRTVVAAVAARAPWVPR